MKKKYAYKFILGLLPFALLVSSFIPLWAFGKWMVSSFEIPLNASIRSQPIGIVWLLAFLIVMAELLIGSIVLGGMINALILRYVFRWPSEEIYGMLINGQNPPEWEESRDESESISHFE